MLTAQITAQVMEQISSMLVNALYFECSLASSEFSCFKEGFKKAVDMVARDMGYDSRDELQEKCRFQTVGELIEFMLRIHQGVEKRRGASQEAILALYYGDELLPSTGTVSAILLQIKECAAKAENEIVRIVMEILYGCAMLAIPSMR
jgi:hypothetical protein